MSVIIDSHNHIGIRHGAAQSGLELLAKMDAAAVDRAIILPFVEGSIDNDVVAREAEADRERLIPFCAVNPWDGEDAIAEMRRCVEDLGFKGVKLHPTLHGYRLGDHGLVDPVFAAARDLGIIVTSHGASDLYNNPAEFGEMAGTFPEVPLMMVHMGYFWETDLAIEMSGRHQNLYLDTSRAPIFEILQAVREVGPEKVIWGTDSPFVDYEIEFGKMARIEDPVDYELVVGGNIARLLQAVPVRIPRNVE
jgi:predicted TIM-barrel fold metal-dependent hydrolase